MGDREGINFLPITGSAAFFCRRKKEMFASVCQMVCSGRSIFRKLINLLSSFTLDRSHVSVRERGRREKSAAGDQQNSSKEEEATTTAVPSEKKERVTRHFQMAVKRRVSSSRVPFGTLTSSISIRVRFSLLEVFFVAASSHRLRRLQSEPPSS